MDRKMLLAILLSMVVVLIFQKFFFPKSVPVEHPTNRPDTAESRAVPSQTLPEPAQEAISTADNPSSVSEFDSWNQAEREKESIIVTETYRAVFTNRGGTLKSWQLLGFYNPAGDPVELVRGERELGLKLVGAGVSPLDNILYAVRQETVTGGAQRLVFTAGSNGREVVKTFTLPLEGYLARMDVQLHGFDRAEGYRVTWNDGIPMAEANPKQYNMSAGTMVLVGKNKQTLKPGKFGHSPQKIVEGNVHWAGVRNKYFAAIVVPPAETSSRVVATGSKEAKITGMELVMPLTGGNAGHTFDLWLGPLDYGQLKDAGHSLQKAVDLGWKFFRHLSKLLLAVMVWLHGYIPNYGWVIILFSAATKVLFYPLTRSSIRSMKAMQQLQPEMAKIKEKYKDEPKRLQSQMMKLYKEKKVNPIGGCLPMLLQMPVFIALYRVLNNDVAVRNAHFMGWITDLSSPDTLFTVGGFGIHILPVILFGFTLLQQLLTPGSADPRQKMMGYMMPLVTLFIFYGFPSGLNLYWTVNSIMTVAQTWMIHREPIHTSAPA